MAMARPAGTRHATGGMVTKLEAARMCRDAGIHTVLANGADPHILVDILAGRTLGTLFLARPRTLPARKHWILHHLPRRGTLVVDEGARQAIENHGKSLLPKGIREVRGNFSSGDGIVIAGPTGEAFALGITNYGREDLIRIAGKNSTETASLLGPQRDAEAVHRDNLVLLAAESAPGGHADG
jgi:glutamate 5-kinase